MQEKQKFILVVLSRLKRKYGNRPKTRLKFLTPWQLLVSTILSAQATDASVNKATSRLFKLYKTPEDFAKLKPSQLYAFTKSIGLYKGKSSNIIKTAKILVKNFNSKVPKSISKLVLLPGVGRKTANVVLSEAYGINEGIAIDTHCITVSNRLGLTDSKNPEKIERVLMDIVPNSEWGSITNLFIALGRDTCTAKNRHCSKCVLKDICPSSTVALKEVRK
ncbi:MAG: endonuclease III [Candidatus Micrarchaeia archaeon]